MTYTCRLASAGCRHRVANLGAEPDHVKGVEDRNRVGHLVTDRVDLAPERIQRSLFDAGGKPVGLGLQPGLIGGSGPSHHGVEKSGVEASVLVTGQIDHYRHCRSVPTQVASPAPARERAEGADRDRRPDQAQHKTRALDLVPGR